MSLTQNCTSNQINVAVISKIKESFHKIFILTRTYKEGHFSLSVDAFHWFYFVVKKWYKQLIKPDSTSASFCFSS